MNAICKLAPATPRFAREAWTQHPNFPSHLLLLGSHESFLSISKTLVARSSLLEGSPTIGWRDDTRYLFDWWQRAMLSHEHYEEAKLYPYLSERYCVSLAPLVGDHREIDALRIAVTDAVADGDMAAIRDAFSTFHATLARHLRDEEDWVIPMLLDLEPDEFRRYSLGPARPANDSRCGC